MPFLPLLAEAGGTAAAAEGGAAAAGGAEAAEGGGAVAEGGAPGLHERIGNLFKDRRELPMPNSNKGGGGGPAPGDVLNSVKAAQGA